MSSSATDLVHAHYSYSIQAVANLKHLEQRWSKGGFVSVLVDQDTAEVEAAGVMVLLVDLN